MLIEICYRDFDAVNNTATLAIKENYPDIKLYSQKFWNKRHGLVKKLIKIFGNLASGNEGLYINVDTDNPGIINVNGNKYRLVN